MTEAEWLSTTDPGPLLSLLQDTATERKKRLFVCGCCRVVWDERWSLRCRRAVEVAEQFADGLATERELDRAHSLAVDAGQSALEVPNRLGRYFFAAETVLRRI